MAFSYVKLDPYARALNSVASPADAFYKGFKEARAFQEQEKDRAWQDYTRSRDVAQHGREDADRADKEAAEAFVGSVAAAGNGADVTSQNVMPGKKAKAASAADKWAESKSDAGEAEVQHARMTAQERLAAGAGDAGEAPAREAEMKRRAMENAVRKQQAQGGGGVLDEELRRLGYSPEAFRKLSGRQQKMAIDMLVDRSNDVNALKGNEVERRRWASEAKEAAFQEADANFWTSDAGRPFAREIMDFANAAQNWVQQNPDGGGYAGFSRFMAEGRQRLDKLKEQTIQAINETVDPNYRGRMIAEMNATYAEAWSKMPGFNTKQADLQAMEDPLISKVLGPNAVGAQDFNAAREQARSIGSPKAIKAVDAAYAAWVKKAMEGAGAEKTRGGSVFNQDTGYYNSVVDGDNPDNSLTPFTLSVGDVNVDLPVRADALDKLNENRNQILLLDKGKSRYADALARVAVLKAISDNDLLVHTYDSPENMWQDGNSHLARNVHSMLSSVGFSEAEVARTMGVAHNYLGDLYTRTKESGEEWGNTSIHMQAIASTVINEDQAIDSVLVKVLGGQRGSLGGSGGDGTLTLNRLLDNARESVGIIGALQDWANKQDADVILPSQFNAIFTKLGSSYRQLSQWDGTIEQTAWTTAQDALRGSGKYINRVAIDFAPKGVRPDINQTRQILAENLYETQIGRPIAAGDPVGGDGAGGSSAGAAGGQGSVVDYTQNTNPPNPIAGIAPAPANVPMKDVFSHLGDVPINKHSGTALPPLQENANSGAGGNNKLPRIMTIGKDGKIHVPHADANNNNLVDDFWLGGAINE